MVTDSVFDSGVTLTFWPFQLTSGDWISTGFAEVGTGNLAGGFGNDMEIFNIVLAIDFGRPVEGLRFFFGEYGGNTNLTINGDFRNEEDFSLLHGQIVGGTMVEVLSLPGGLGILRIMGTVSSFPIGGQELAIDDVCDSTIFEDGFELGDTSLWSVSVL